MDALFEYASVYTGDVVARIDYLENSSREYQPV